jgi:hypothetical protein
VLLVVLLIALLASAPAAAAAPPGESSDSPSLNQYVEQIPTAKGDRPTGGGGGGALPRDVRRQLGREGGPDAEALGDVATSPALGAPQPRARRSPSMGAPATSADQAGGTSALDAAVGAAADGGLGWLLAVAVAMAAAAAGVTLARRRSADS